MTGVRTTSSATNQVVIALGNTNFSDELSTFLNDKSSDVVFAKSLNDGQLQQKRKLMSKSSTVIESLVFVMPKSEFDEVYNNPLELANWKPLLRSDSSIELHVIEDEETSPSKLPSLQPIHTSFLLAGLKATSEEQQPTKIILRAEMKKKTWTKSQPITIKESSNLRINLTDDTTDESDDSTSASDKLSPIDRMVLTLGCTEKLEEVSLFAKNKKTKVVSVKSLNDDVLQEQRKEVLRDSLMFDSFVIFMNASEVAAVYNNPLELANWVPLLRSDSSIEFRIIKGGTISPMLQPIHTSFLLAGLKASSEENTSTQLVLRAERKKKTSTQSQPIRIKKSSSSILRISLDDATITDDDDGSSLLDEDDLLNDALFTPSLVAPKRDTDDCAGRKPCDNCSCGRAQVYADEQKKKRKKLTKKEMISKSSACGNCPKGDAFRCASCPFLGKAAFKPGEEHLVLDLVDDF